MSIPLLISSFCVNVTYDIRLVTDDMLQKCGGQIQLVVDLISTKPLLTQVFLPLNYFLYFVFTHWFGDIINKWIFLWLFLELGGNLLSFRFWVALDSHCLLVASTNKPVHICILRNTNKFNFLNYYICIELIINKLCCDWNLCSLSLLVVNCIR